MKATFTRKPLLDSFTLAAAVAPARSPKPILQNVLLTVRGDGVSASGTLSATDLECGIAVNCGSAYFSVDVRVAADAGSVLLPVGRFGDILKQADGELVTVATDDRHVVVTSDRGQWKMPTGKPDEFPGVPPFGSEFYHELPQAALRGLLRRTMFACDVSATRFALGGVLLEFGPGSITGVGCDGRRMAVAEVPATRAGEHASTTMTVVPLRTCKMIERSLGEDGTASVSADANKIMVRTPDATLYSRLVEGRFPLWRDVLPQASAATIELPTEPFHAAIRQAAIMTDEESVGVDFEFGDGKLSLSARRQDAGESHVELPVAFDGSKLGITLNPYYVGEFLRAVSSDTVELALIDEKTAAVFREPGIDCRYVVMPLARRG